jgi:hypothetical protein
MRRLSTLLLALTLTTALPAFAQVHLLPQSAVVAADGARLGAELVTHRPDRSGLAVMALGVTTLVGGAASLLVGLAATGAGNWELFVPLVVVVPLVTTLLGTVLIVAGAVVGVPPDDDTAARDELAPRRAALLKLREAEPASSTEGCAEQPAMDSSMPTPTTLSEPPLVPVGHVRGPLKPAPAPAP